MRQARHDAGAGGLSTSEAVVEGHAMTKRITLCGPIAPPQARLLTCPVAVRCRNTRKQDLPFPRTVCTLARTNTCSTQQLTTAPNPGTFVASEVKVPPLMQHCIRPTTLSVTAAGTAQA